MTQLQETRSLIRAAHLRNETQTVQALIEQAALPKEQRSRISREAVALVTGIRGEASPGLMDVFLAEYGLSTDEGVALMCLAEALLRVPDAETVDALIEDKIAPSEWGKHLGQSSSSLVNASTWALLLTGKVLDDDQPGFAGVLRGALKRLGEPVIRAAVSRAMKEMGAQFVLGQTIEEALKRGGPQVTKGYTYSYDMLGEAALTQADADTFFTAYSDAISKLSTECTATDIRENPGISIKLSALHPRYEVSQKTRVMEELVPRTLELAQAAKAAGMGLNIDAEEADRLDLSLDVIEAVLRDPSLTGWDGFGVVPVTDRLGRVWRGCTGLWPTRCWGSGLALSALDRIGPQDHGSTGKRCLLGYRNQTFAGRRPKGFPCFHPEGCDRYFLHHQCQEAFGHDRPDLSTVCDPQCPYRRRSFGPCHRSECF